MQAYLRPALRRTAVSAKTFASQVTVAVTTAVCVTFITNALLKQEAVSEEPAAVVSDVATTSVSPGEQLATPYELEAVTISDVPAPLSRAPGTLSAGPAPSFAQPAGLYYAETEQLTDPLELLARSGTLGRDGVPPSLLPALSQGRRDAVPPRYSPTAFLNSPGVLSFR